MYRRTWTPLEYVKKDTNEQIHFYDSGIICGILCQNEWSSWEIISRTIDASGTIIEMLKEMPQDYVPFQVIHKESHPLYEFNQDRIEIPCWDIRLEQVQDLQAVQVQKVLQVQKASQVQKAPQVQKPAQVQKAPQVQKPAQPQKVSQAQKLAQPAQWPPEVLNQLPRPAPRPPQRPIWPAQPPVEPSKRSRRGKKPRYNNATKSSDQHQSPEVALGAIGQVLSGPRERLHKIHSQQTQSCIPVQRQSALSVSGNTVKPESHMIVHQYKKEA